ncbi:hypothetical protein ACN9MU_10360 [Pseudoduganella sp. R-32]|uniref:hypothetical protein n=1 Tax=unclassified Pseudoduganella TaxID=2637179 RepID=UPI003CEF3250
MKKILCFAMLTGALSSVALAADEKKEVSATAAPQFPRADPPLFIDVSNKCPVTKSGQDDSPMLLIAGALLKPLVDTVVPAATGWLYDKGVQALAKHNEKKTSSSTAVQTTMLYSPDAKKFSFGCITLIRAPHGRAESDNYLKLSKDLNAKLSADSPWHAIDKDSAIGKLNLARVPDFYMELTLGSEKSSPAPVAPAAAKKTPPPEAKQPRTLYRTLRPGRLDYFNTGAEDGKRKHVSVELHMDIMEANGEWKPFYAKTYDLGMLSVNSENVDLQSQGKDTFLPPLPRTTADGYIDPIPLRITAVLTETEDNLDLGRAIETALKEDQHRKAVVDAASTSIGDAIKDAIDKKTGTASTPAK